ncbi:winged helix-turn-helix domain-containing protein [Phytoactinopolyspora endophytica]|uniref:winged helix-turn-helix domain-containing protein n=1 Tax=Phytoactinopolyspora endophytica TaxID=1642495 RepID=UPI00101C14BD|nr:winged helix-turn-helix domain-containing protein [Phytoactinopolyspora endophytica]
MSVPEFDPNAGGPGYLYLKLADFLAELIEAQHLKPNSRLPGERDFAEQYDVSIGTVRRATDELRERKLVVTLPAKGNFIAPLEQQHRNRT